MQSEHLIVSDKVQFCRTAGPEQTQQPLTSVPKVAFNNGPKKRFGFDLSLLDPDQRIE